MKFEDWFYEQLNHSLRAEWFHNDAEIAGKLGDTQALVRWLKAAYDVGREHENLDWVQSHWDDGK